MAEGRKIQTQEDNALYRRGEPDLVLTVVCRSRPQPKSGNRFSEQVAEPNIKENSRDQTHVCQVQN
ncbi:hypothetical protein CLV89_103367 [Tritonibacter scottomollicae]|uniref:Uncharacterized protein n=1 Tax=Tritonibacter scottomollicae TaxID=483013 RepID=A0A2T1AKH6_TRISK|nr:hypothetical protein CLV89_103367 [Tritonibacter scottomollicae]